MKNLEICSKYKYDQDWPIILNMWSMKIGTNLSREGILAFEDVGFQMHQREALSPCCRLLKITSPPIPWSHFHVPPNLHTYLTSTFLKTMHQHSTTTIIIYKNKWKSTNLMDGNYVIESLPFHM